jgi:Zn-dependent peptidase ImmA (M78 family)/DNA-binding XRE family transcriptional regulator
VIGDRIRQVRVARGLSLEELAAAMGGVVSRQALWKYEHGMARPSARVLAALSSALQTPAAALWCAPEYTVEFVAYRKGSGLRKRDQARVEAMVALALQERLQLRDRAGVESGPMVTSRRYLVPDLTDAETAARELRSQWALGEDPIANVVDVLEANGVHVLEIEAPEKFDGISAVAYDQTGQVQGAAVVTRRGLPGERQRLDLAHELGHLVLDVAAEVDEEKAAFRFAGAFLAPASTLRKEMGAKRAKVQLTELRLLKRRFGMSIQALLKRLYELEIITMMHYREWCITINRLGYRKDEPDRLAAEQPQWLRRTALRALAEGQISPTEAQQLTGEAIVAEQPLSLVERRALLRLPLSERRRVLAEQAARIAHHYDGDPEWRELGGGDIEDG